MGNTTLASLVIAISGNTQVVDLVGAASFLNLADITNDITLAIFVDGAVGADQVSLDRVTGNAATGNMTALLQVQNLSAGNHTFTLVATATGDTVNTRCPAGSAWMQALKIGA